VSVQGLIPSLCSFIISRLDDVAVNNERYLSCNNTTIVAIYDLKGHREETKTANGINWLRHPEVLLIVLPNTEIKSLGKDADTKELSAKV
jgi:hypothetical protein